MSLEDSTGGSLMRIDENELVFSSTAWDVEFVGQTLTIRDAPRVISLRVCFKPPRDLHILAAKLPVAGGILSVTDDAIITPNGSTFSGCTGRDNGGGFSFR